MDGERILEAEPTIGYIHRAFEKIAENRPFYQITPLTDRMNYCSSPINNMGWWMTLEKLLGVEVPKRAVFACHRNGTRQDYRSFDLQLHPWCRYRRLYRIFIRVPVP
jgi:hypothetical protein